MNSIFPLVALGVLATAPAQSGEPALSAGVQEGLASAPRELDLIKAARDPSDRARIPGLTLPEAPPPVLEAPSRRPGAAQPARQPGSSKTSPGWLVEAMERKAKPDREQGEAADRSPRDEVDRRTKSPESSSFPTDDEASRSNAAEDDGRRPRARGVAESARRVEPAPNPLQPFLQAWMTAGDLALMKPVLDSASPGGSVAGGSGPAAVAGPSGLVPPSFEPRFVGNANDTRGRANPYLEPMNAPVAAPSAVPPLPPAREPAIVFSAIPTQSAPAETAVDRSRTPPFVKPQADEKLFRTLKRF